MRAVAERALRCQRDGNDVVLIVSAMSGETNRLLGLAHQISPTPEMREMDALAATGEQVSAALVAMTVHALGGKARSLLGHQVNVQTDAAFTKARIQTIEGSKVRSTLDKGEIAVVAGFQGVDPEGNITTLGRGGSDTSAVAVAAAIKADVCEIYTDVDGVYTTDPNVCPNARKIERVSYEEMLELASLGAKVLQIRSVELGMKHGGKIHVRSSFNKKEGTWVVPEETAMEDVVVAGVSANRDEAKITLFGVPDQPGVAARIFKPLTAASIVVDMIIQNVSSDGRGTDLTFTVPKGDCKRAVELLKTQCSDLCAGGERLSFDDGVAKVSIVGVGMRSHAGVAQRMFEMLANEGINIIMISTSEIRISVVIESKYTELAVRVLHDGFGLDKPPAQRVSVA